MYLSARNVKRGRALLKNNAMHFVADRDTKSKGGRRERGGEEDFRLVFRGAEDFALRIMARPKSDLMAPRGINFTDPVISSGNNRDVENRCAAEAQPPSSVSCTPVMARVFSRRRVVDHQKRKP